jgi:murein L,D-transpeptidase YcbB/YkuD
MMVRIFVALLGLIASASAAASQGKPLRLDLNIPAHRLVVYEGDTPIRTYRVAVGMKGHDTPTGSFAISRAEWNPWWRPPEREWARGEKPTPPGPSNPMGRVKLFFMPYYFIHGTPDKESIGTAASHGCVRMLNTDVVALSRLLHERAAPQVTPKTIDGILARSGTTRRVNFNDSIPLVVRYDLFEADDKVIRVYPDVYGYKRMHSEGVYQALLAAGYDVRNVDGDAVQRLVERARRSKAPFSVPVKDALGVELAAAER